MYPVPLRSFTILVQQKERYVFKHFQTDKRPITYKDNNETVHIGMGTEYEGQDHIVSGWGTTSSG